MIWYASFIVCRMKDTSRKNNMFAQFRKNERDKQKLIDTVVKQLKNLIATNQAWESQRISRRPASWWFATIRACRLRLHIYISWVYCSFNTKTLGLTHTHSNAPLWKGHLLKHPVPVWYAVHVFLCTNWTQRTPNHILLFKTGFCCVLFSCIVLLSH